MFCEYFYRRWTYFIHLFYCSWDARMAQSSPTSHLYSHETLELQTEEIILRGISWCPLSCVPLYISRIVFGIFSFCPYIGDARLDKVGFDSGSDSSSVLFFPSPLLCLIRLQYTASLLFFNYTKIPVIFQSMICVGTPDEFTLKCEIQLQHTFLLTYLLCTNTQTILSLIIWHICDWYYVAD